MLALLLTVACSPPAPQRPAPPPVAIGWDVPPGCPDRAVVDATLARLLAGSPRDASPEITAVVSIEHAGAARFVARVQLGADARVLEAASCNEVAQAALLIVAMAIDPRIGGPADPRPSSGEAPGDTAPDVIPEPSAMAAPDAAQTGAAPETSAQSQPADVRSTPVAEPARRRQRTPVRALLRAGAGIGVGGPPAPSAVVALGAAIAGLRWRVEIDGDVWTPRRRTAPADPRVGAEMLAWSVGVRGCGSPIAGRFELPLCGGLRAGALRGRGTGSLRSSTASSPWVVAVAGVGLWGWVVPRFAVALDVEGLVALARPGFRVDPAGLVYTAPEGGLRAVFGAVVRLP